MTNLKRSLYHIKEMDCPSEENMIRMALEKEDLARHLEFRLAERELVVHHEAPAEMITMTLRRMFPGTQLLESLESSVEHFPLVEDRDRRDAHMLGAVLIINALFFGLEAISGWISGSLGLLADSLDMLADASVYSLSLFAIYRKTRFRNRIARMSGILQMALAMAGFLEVIHRFLGKETPPDFLFMVGVALLALLANTTSLWLLQRTSGEGAHMKASLIFTSNDIMANLGVIFAGILVCLTGSGYPDLIIGFLVFALVFRGALKIWKLG